LPEGVERALNALLEDRPVAVLEPRTAGGPDGDRVRAALDRYRNRIGAAFLHEFVRAKEQGLVDWDGGGVGDPDPECVHSPWRRGEGGDEGGCGLGAELLLWLPALAALRRRRSGRGA